MTDLWFATTPFQIEIINHAQWWQPYLPPLLGLLGSVIVAAAAFYGVQRSYRTNQETNIAADKREFAKWRRETILRLCGEIQGHAREVEDICAAGIKLQKEGDVFDFGPARDRCRQMLTIAYQFTYVEFSDATTKSADLYKAGMDLIRTSQSMHDGMNQQAKRLRSGLYTKPLDPDQVKALELQIAEFEQPQIAAAQKFRDAETDFAYRATFEFYSNLLTKAQTEQAMADVEKRKAKRE